LFCSILVVTTSTRKLIRGACQRLAHCFIAGVVTTSLQKRQNAPPTVIW